MAQNMALYRKWRPLSFGDVVGQEHITSALKAQAVSGRISHAYLFCGTRGTGKTTCAKILARAACCENPRDGEPCNKCPSCLSMLSDSASDFSEIDAASNNGVDNVREIREEALYSPAVLSHRIYIIDEVHMLSQSAFNALLKILEEPPAHVLFILATTEVHKIPPTILSRCQRFDFRRIAPEVIAKRLLYIAQQEGYDLTESAALSIARLGDGSMRDSISLYDRCMPYDGRVDDERVAFSLGLPGDDAVCGIMKALVSGDAGSALARFTELYTGGKDIVTLFDRLLGLIRDIYIVKATGKKEYLVSFPFDKVSELEKMCSTDILEFYIACISDLLSRVTRTSAKRADGEICLFKMAMGKSASAPNVTLSAPSVTPALSAQTAAPVQAEPKAAPQPAQAAHIGGVPIDEIPFDIEPRTQEASAPAQTAPPPQSAPKAPASAPAAPEALRQEAPKRTESPGNVSQSRLKSDFEALVLHKVNSAVKVYLPRSEITAVGSKLKIEPPQEALRFMQREAATFREAAKSLGFDDVLVGGSVPKPTASDVLNTAERLGIKIIKE